MTVVVAGALANKAGSGGEAWVRMSWLRGLQGLGLDVRFVEQLAAPTEDALGWFRSVTRAFGVADVSTLLVDGEAVLGPGADVLLELAPEATLVNISGHLTDGRLFPRFRRRALVDIDPGFTQFWHAARHPGARVEGHDAYFTIAENIGLPGCGIPTGGIEWRPVRQPVVLADWPVVPGPEPERFTTVANWRGPFGPVEHGGRTYGLKVHEFRKFLELPLRSPYTFEMALNIHPVEERDIAALGANGWRVVDPAQVAGDPAAFRSYIQGSGAEFSVAQGIYVDTASGWFSDRTIRYLASGKPALVQDTGFGRFLPVGQGLVAFHALEEAVEGAAHVVARYDEHAAAARAVAEEHFAADRVLPRFCDQAGIEP